MAFCQKCGTQLPDGAKFCGVCGKPLGQSSFDQPQKTNGLAIASLILGIVTLAGLGSLLAIVFGFIANSRIDRSDGREKGKGLAIAGIVLGFLGLAFALLVALAIPTFLGARMRAQDRVAQSAMRNTITNAKAIFTDHEDYRDATQQQLAQAEPSLTYVAASVDSTSPTTISSGALAPTTFMVVAKSVSGTCWYAREVDDASSADAGLTWNRVKTPTSCRANEIPISAWVRSPATL
jgi:type II secretory pathway pseudopilin PulG